MAYASIEDKRRYHREYMKDMRHWRKDHHCCVDCGEQDAYTLSGRSRCYDCAEKKNIRDCDSKKKELRRDKEADYQKKRHDYRIENHLCTICGTKLPPSNYPYVTCQTCRAKSRSKQEQRRRDSGIIPREEYSIYGLCAMCGLPASDKLTKWSGEKRRVCDSCYEHVVNMGKKGREAYKEKYKRTWGQMQYQYSHGREKAKNTEVR